jgi:hypothetical protein
MAGQFPCIGGAGVLGFYIEDRLAHRFLSGVPDRRGDADESEHAGIIAGCGYATVCGSPANAG